MKAIPYYPLKADIWSLGVVLSSMFNGIMPFNPRDRDLVNKMMSRKMKVKMEKMNLLSIDASTLLFNAIDPDPSTRFDIYQLAASPWLAPMQMTK
jgi:serine/threonine protein kinase